MKRVLARISLTYAAYVCFLLGFVALGMFVYALAVGSGLAGIIAGSLIGFFAAAVVGFRAGARRVVRADESGNPVDGANVWAQPVRRAEIDRYLLNYRGVQHSENDAARDTDVPEHRLAA